MKRIIAILLAAVLLFGTAPSADAVDMDETMPRAEALAALGLLRGTDKGYELESRLGRAQGLTMLVRLLGKEAEAEAAEHEHPFTDVPEWAEPYVGYAWENGITKGRDVEKGIFDPYGEMYVEDFVTFILRALGYSDADGDFEYAKCLDKAFEIGLVTARGKQMLKSYVFTRADMVDISYSALSCEMYIAQEEVGETEASESAELAENEGETEETSDEEKNLTLAGSLVEAGVFTVEQAEKFIAQYMVGQVGPDGPLEMGLQSFYTSQGEVEAYVISIDMSDPDVSVRAAIVEDRVGARDSFYNIVSDSGAVVSITGNFMDNDKNDNLPLGHIMIDGEMKYVSSGFSSLGITADGDLRYGRPSIFTRIKPSDESRDYSWVAFGTNVDEKYQSPNFSVIYTPVYGDSFEVMANGCLMTVREGVVTAYEKAEIQSVVEIPEDGYVMFIGYNFTWVETWDFHEPTVGEEVVMEYYLEKEDPEGFTMEDMQFIISSGPRLVTDGEEDHTLEYQLDGPRFKTDKAERIAVGSTADGYMIMVSVEEATIQQMREIMLALGCVDAINMDGGASAAMYCDGEFVKEAGRKLANTIQVFVG